MALHHATNDKPNLSHIGQPQLSLPTVPTTKANQYAIICLVWKDLGYTQCNWHSQCADRWTSSFQACSHARLSCPSATAHFITTLRHIASSITWSLSKLYFGDRLITMIWPPSTNTQPHVASGPPPWSFEVEKIVNTRAPFERSIPSVSEVWALKM